MNIKIAFVLMLFTLLLLGCKEDKADLIAERSIIGKWEISESKRNYKVTTTLKDGYFEFLDDTNMKTNILGEDGQYSYKRNKDIIDQSMALNGESIIQDNKITYVIDHLTLDTMIMKAVISRYNFEFLAIKNRE